ncbi:hypothetical protein SAMN05216456_3252 [Devosia crocina]|uniref:Uncharacterized protein n=1 Tax=Devosia crocina TaxID=429728 RepID=A0A1I7NTV4_9HYPH|nr:hypothetical protein [Devosia crocina]SFV38087.1 hypothetical protein SAMN05216456_3252 [Devosia crocina]
MQRLVLLIAILLSLATLLGVTTAHAHRYQASPLVVLNHVDADNVPIRIMVTVQRGEIDLGEGIVMPCGSHQAIPAEGPALPQAPEPDCPAAHRLAAETGFVGKLRLRPPKHLPRDNSSHTFHLSL